jgi:lipoprotein NlpD
MTLQTLALRTCVLSIAAAGLVACGTTPLPPYPAPSTQPVPGVPAPQPQQATFIRPAAGSVIARFDGGRNKGIDIAGNLGDPILAAADGRVVYVGGELRGYGNMVIIKHNETFLTAYAHAQTILVKENSVVRQGQKIAEMGQSDADRVKLHFEIRKDGTAVDPEPYLSGRLR